METRNRIIEILRGIDRPGMQSVLDFLEHRKSYWAAKCYGHHRYSGGMADHALEVYDYMISHNFLGLPPDSIAIAALFHDLGKASAARGQGFHGAHPARSVQKLDKLGLALTNDERMAIGCHHTASVNFITCPLRVLLHLGDMDSTGRWKRAHQLGK